MNNNWFTPKGITAIILLVGALGTAIVITAAYITLPKDVEAVEQEIIDLKKIIDYYYQSDQRQEPYRNQRNQAPQYQQTPRECWDDYYREWYFCEDYQ